MCPRLGDSVLQSLLLKVHKGLLFQFQDVLIEDEGMSLKRTSSPENNSLI